MDAAISCLPPALLATSFADAAIARALHFSNTTMSSSPGSSSSSLSHHHHSPLLAALPSPCPYYAPPPPPPAVAATCCDSVLVADSSPRRRTTHQRRAGNNKRRSRASKRAPTTYISTDPANFRLMVQHVTGVQADLPLAAGGDVHDMDMLHHVQALDAAAGNRSPQLLPAGDDASALQLQQQPCFPTLDSWNVVMCETSSAQML